MSLIVDFIYSSKRLLAKRGALVVKALVFIILILILGSVFEESFNGKTVEEINSAYVLLDEGTIGQELFDNLTSEKNITEYLKLKKYDYEDKAEKALSEGKVDALIVIPENFSEEMQLDDKKAQIQVYMTSFSGLKSEILKNIMKGIETQFNADVILSKLNNNVQNKQKPEQFTEPLDYKGRNMDSMTYYTIAMLLMMLFYGADYGSTSVAEEYLGTFGMKMKIVPGNRFIRQLGQFLGISVINAFLGVFVLIVSSIIFRVNWGRNPVILLVLLIFSLLCTVFGGVLCLIAGNERKASGLIQIFALFFTIISGGFYAGDFPGIKYLSFNHYAKMAINGILLGGSSAVIWKNIGVMLGLILALITIFEKLSTRRRGDTI